MKRMYRFELQIIWFFIIYFLKYFEYPIPDLDFYYKKEIDIIYLNFVGVDS